MASELPCQWPSAPSLQLPHTHNKHTLSPVRPNHTAQREHINYRYTLNYFHYLPCSVDGTETAMMDGKGFALLPQVANAPSFIFSHPFLACSFFILHQLSCGLHLPICLLHLSPNFFVTTRQWECLFSVTWKRAKCAVVESKWNANKIWLYFSLFIFAHVSNSTDWSTAKTLTVIPFLQFEPNFHIWLHRSNRPLIFLCIPQPFFPVSPSNKTISKEA